MASDLERLILRISGDASELKRALQASERDVRSSASSMQKAFGVVSGSLAQIAGLLGVAFSVSYLADLASDALAAADALQDTADRIGIGVEALQELRFAASQADVEATQLDAALAKLARTQSEAATGEKKQAEAFTSIGVAVKDAAGNLVPLEQLVPKVADGLKGLASQQDRVRIAAELFGRGAGAMMVNVLQQGSQGLAEMSARARELGIVLDAALVKRSAEASDQLDALKLAAGTPLQEALLALAPILVALAEGAGVLARGVRDIVVSFQSLENRSAGALESQLAELIQRRTEIQRRLAEAQQSGDARRVGVLTQAERDIQAEMDRVVAARLAVEARAKATSSGAGAAGGTTGGTTLQTTSSVRTGKTDEEKEAERLARERESFREVLDRELATASGSKLAQLDYDREKALETARELYTNQQDLARVESDINSIYDTRAGALFDALVGGYEDQIDRADKLKEAGTKALDELRDGAEEFGASLSRAFADAIVDGELTFKGLGESFLRDFVSKGFEGVTGLATTALFGTGKNGDNGILGDLLGTAISGIFGGFFAEGGRPPTGRASIVGERGPEWFVPDAPGTIVPRGAAIGAAETIEIPVYVQNYTSAPVRVEKRQTGDGRAEIYAIIGDVINRDLAANGQISRGIATRFRLQPAGA